MSSDLRHGFYLGSLLVEPSEGRIGSGLRSIKLPPPAMQVLLCLAENAGDAVTQRDLIERTGTVGDDGPAVLSQAITELRQALDDPEDKAEFLQVTADGAYRLNVRPVPPTQHIGSPGTEPPASPSGAELGLFDNLKQRGVIQTALAYLVVGWLIVQVVDVIFDQLHLPDWAGTFVTVLVIAGFPIALVLSWFLEFREGRAVLDDLSVADAKQRHLSRTYISVISALVIAAGAVFIYDRNVGLPESEPVQTVQAVEETVLPPVLDNSIAVLPFVNMDGSNETQVFTQGLVDDVTNRLSRVPGLLVSSRGDSFTLEPNTASDKVRDRLRVALYLEGSVQMQDERMRIIIQLIDSKTGFHVLSRSFDRLREDFFDIRDEITALTVANVRVALPPDTQAATTVSAGDPSLDAYILYRRGVDASRLPASTETMERALSWFDQALEIDPDYAAAHAGKCSVFVASYPISDDPAFIDRAETACAKALELNPNLDIVHIALGNLYSATGKYDQAEAAYLEALESNPKSVASLAGLGNIYRLQQRYDEAETRLNQAIGQHPGDWSAYSALAYFLYRSGRYAEAAEQYEVVVALDSNNMSGYTNLGTAYMLAGDFEAAVAAFENVIDIEPRQLAYSNLGLMHYYLGQYEASVEAHGQAVKLGPNDHLAWSNLGDALWIFGKPEQARDAFRTAEELASSALQVNPNDPGYLMDLAWITAMLDKTTEADKLITRAREQAPDDPYVHYIQGLMLLRNEKPDEALASFASALAHGYSVQMLVADPQLDRLRGDSEFERMTEQAKGL